MKKGGDNFTAEDTEDTEDKSCCFTGLTLRVLRVLRGRGFSSVLSGSKPLLGGNRDQGVPLPQFDDAPVVLGLRKFLPDQAIAQPSQLVAVEVADELVDARRMCPFRWMDAVPPQLGQDIFPIVKRALTRQAFP